MLKGLLKKPVIADLVGVLLALFQIVATSVNPDQDTITRILMVLAGLVGLALGWHFTRKKNRILRMLGIPAVTILSLMVVAVIWSLIQSLQVR